MKTNLFLGLLALCSVAFTTGAEAFSCYRHIYNKSGSPWITGGSGSYGNVYMWMDPVTPRCRKEYCQSAKGCQLPPACTAEYQMTTTGGRGEGVIVFKDHNGKQGQFPYSFDTDQCPYIFFGPSGPISTNHPANGDYVINGNQW